MHKHLLQTWLVAYEKAILKTDFALAKHTIDKACCEAAEDWIKRLYSLGIIEEIKGRELDTIEACINHYIDNLVKGKMWNEKIPTVEQTNEGENVFMITVPECGYKEACKSGLDVPEFRNNGNYRCLRLGCFVGAIKKYVREDKLPEDKREKLDYFMTVVMDEQEGCKGLIFINENFLRGILVNRYPTKLPNQ